MKIKNFFLLFIGLLILIISGIVFPASVTIAENDTHNDESENHDNNTVVVDPAVCGFDDKEGRTIVEFNAGTRKLHSDKTIEKARLKADVVIASGIYDITLVSYDGYKTRSKTDPQHNEEWFLKLKNGEDTIAKTSAISDLKDGVTSATLIEQIENGFIIEQDLDSVVAFHAAYPNTDSANSVVPVCAVFDEVEAPNQKPEITLSATTTTITVGDDFDALSFATASDPEDGDITGDIVIGGDVVSSSTPIGTYTITYNVSDSEGFAADEAALKVVVEEEPNQKPEITLSATTTTITVGDDFDALSFATASDPEDGDITSSIIASSTVSTSTPGTYQVTYNVSDSKGLAADEVVLEVVVIEGGPKQCVNNVSARIIILDTQNWGNGDVTEDIYLGSTTTVIASGEWFPLYENGAYINDPDMTSAGYEDVPGLAVQRVEGSVRVVLHGSSSNGSKEHVSGKIEFSGTDILGFRSDDSGNNKLENGFNGSTSYSAINDEVWTDKGENFFWMTVTVADDGFYSDYDEPYLCPLDNTKPVITLLGDNPLTLFVGDTYTEPGAVADDLEDGTGLTVTDIIGTVDTSTTGTSTIAYNFTDSDGLAADEVVRTIIVEQRHATPNQKPEITLSATTTTITVGDDFDALSFATASDPEDGDITSSIIASSTVSTSTPGTYQVTYNVSDSKGLAADEVVLEVVVIEGGPKQCSDGIDNDGDGFTDWDGAVVEGDIALQADPGCFGPEDDSENEKPVITLVGDATVNITVGDSYTDAGATALDAEDGDITSDIVVGGDSVDTNSAGTYAIIYNVEDEDGLAADEVVRTVEVKEAGCTANCGGGGDGGGGGGPLPTLRIFNEKLEIISPTSVLFTWETDKDATSRVVFDDESVKQITYDPNVGYASSTEKISTLVKNHSMLITGLTPDTQYFFRPISTASGNLIKVGNEKTFSPNTPLSGQCTYLKDYLRIGDSNDTAEVTKLQKFLRDFEEFSDLEVTGIFDQATFDAVSAFQEKYKDDILTPWGIDDTTGYVYYTTQKKINEIYCEKEFPLSQTQVSEISSFKSLLEQLQTIPGGQNNIDFNAIGQATPATQAPVTGDNAGEASAELALTDGSTNIAGTVEVQNGQVASIIGSTEAISGAGTTTQVGFQRGGMVASVLDAMKSGFTSVINSFTRLFEKDSSGQENADTETSEESTVETAEEPSR